MSEKSLPSSKIRSDSRCESIRQRVLGLLDLILQLAYGTQVGRNTCARFFLVL